MYYTSVDGGGLCLGRGFFIFSLKFVDISASVYHLLSLHYYCM
jgi:hypothetical protein